MPSRCSQLPCRIQSAFSLVLTFLLCFVALLLHFEAVGINFVHNFLLALNEILVLGLSFLRTFVHLLGGEHLLINDALVLGPGFLELVLQMELVKHV